MDATYCRVCLPQFLRSATGRGSSDWRSRVAPIDTLPRSPETATTYPIRGVVQVAYLSVAPCLSAPSISSASAGRVTFESGVCPVEIFHPSGARPLKKEAVEKAEQRISALQMLHELPEREVVDKMATLLCSFDCMESKIDNGPCFGPAAVSFRKKKSHAESSQINHPSAAQSSEPILQMSGKMLDAIEEV